MSTRSTITPPPRALRAATNTPLSSSHFSTAHNLDNEMKSPSSPQKRPKRIADSSNVKVLVRVRPRTPREQESPMVIEMNQNERTTTLLPKPNATNIEPKSFQFDHSLWSVNPSDSHYKSQEDTFSIIGKEILQHTLNGFNTCIFAYGQTGSGKSYTMMGDETNPGIIPQTCLELWDNVQNLIELRKKVHVKISYFEVYNEQVLDLLGDNHGKLKVRENPKTGPYVEGLIEYEVLQFEDFKKFLDMGNKNRTVATTKMNDNSSRSHAVCTISLRIREFGINDNQGTNESDDYIKETTSSLKLVDLAGSERVVSTGATGVRMKEGTNINKSLTTLGRVILSLSDGTTKPPYRDSILTWLLKENLGGNSKTAMIACISPCDYEESLSTLRYATLTKNVKLNATANIDEIQGKDNSEEFKKMKLEIEKLTDSLNEAQKNEDLVHKVTNLSKFFEDKLNSQTEKYQMVKEELIQERNQRNRLENTLNNILKAIDYNELTYQNIEIEHQQLVKRSEDLGRAIADDLEKFAISTL